MANRAIELADFQTYAAWIAEQRNFFRTDRTDDRDHWLVVPFNYTPNVSSLLDDSNWETLGRILAEADPSGATYAIQRFGHWATPYERYIVEPNSAAHQAAAEAICALSDYPVLSDEDWSERESEAAYQNVVDAVRSLTFLAADGAELDSETVADDLYSWFGNNGNWAFLEEPEHQSVRDEERDEGLGALGYEYDDEQMVWRAVDNHEDCVECSECGADG